MREPLIYEISVPSRCGVDMPAPDVPEAEFPSDLMRGDSGLPELSQLDVIRHYLHLSQLNYSIDGGFYPLGSFTMKGNTQMKVNVAVHTRFVFASQTSG